MYYYFCIWIFIPRFLSELGLVIAYYQNGILSILYGPIKYNILC